MHIDTCPFVPVYVLPDCAGTCQLGVTPPTWGTGVVSVIISPPTHATLLETFEGNEGGEGKERELGEKGREEKDEGMRVRGVRR